MRGKQEMIYLTFVDKLCLLRARRPGSSRAVEKRRPHTPNVERRSTLTSPTVGLDKPYMSTENGAPARTRNVTSKNGLRRSHDDECAEPAVAGNADHNIFLYI